MSLTLLLGLLLIPTSQVEAGFLSFVFSAEASSGEEEVNEQNSQNMELLTASAISATSSEGEVVNITTENALVASATPFSGDEDSTRSGGPDFKGETTIYIVREGDTLSEIAEMFDITIDTIRSANNMSKTDKIQPGDVLLILPFSGVEHTVAKGDTLGGIAKKYDVSLNDILLANDIDAKASISIGKKLMIPGASSSTSPNKVASSTKSTTSTSSTKTSSSKKPKAGCPDITGYFTHPLPGSRVTRREGRGHYGVDYAASIGTPIRAAASGNVLIARNGWNGGYGNYVVIRHDNGTQTLYAHMSRLGTSAGARVSQGETIGYVGSSGRSTGPHLHFETKNTCVLVPYF